MCCMNYSHGSASCLPCAILRLVLAPLQSREIHLKVSSSVSCQAAASWYLRPFVSCKVDRVHLYDGTRQANGPEHVPFQVAGRTCL